MKQKQLAEQQWNKKHTAVQQPYKWNKITRLKNSGKYYGGKMHVTTKLRETDNPDRAHWRSRACHFPHSLLITCAHTCMHTHIHTHMLAGLQLFKLLTRAPFGIITLWVRHDWKLRAAVRCKRASDQENRRRLLSEKKKTTDASTRS